MRLLSFTLGLVAVASLASASCKVARPSSSASSFSSSSSASSVITSSSSITSSVASVSSSSSSPVVSASALSSFNLVVRSPDTPFNGYSVESDGDYSFLLINAEPPDSVQPFHLEAGTDYLMVGSLYVLYANFDTFNYLVLSAANELPPDGDPNERLVVCSSPAIKDVAISCTPVGMPSITTFYLYNGPIDDAVQLYDPSQPLPGWVAVSLVPQAV